MDIRARSISFASRPRRPYGPPDHERAGETFSPSPHFDSQTSAGKPTIAFGFGFEPSPRSHRRSLARWGERRWRREAATIPLVNQSVCILNLSLLDARLITALLR